MKRRQVVRDRKWSDTNQIWSDLSSTTMLLAGNKAHRIYAIQIGRTRWIGTFKYWIVGERDLCIRITNRYLKIFLFKNKKDFGKHDCDAERLGPFYRQYEEITRLTTLVNEMKSKSGDGRRNIKRVGKRSKLTGKAKISAKIEMAHE